MKIKKNKLQRRVIKEKSEIKFEIKKKKIHVELILDKVENKTQRF